MKSFLVSLVALCSTDDLHSVSSLAQLQSSFKAAEIATRTFSSFYLMANKNA